MSTLKQAPSDHCNIAGYQLCSSSIALPNQENSTANICTTLLENREGTQMFQLIV